MDVMAIALQHVLPHVIAHVVMDVVDAVTSALQHVHHHAVNPVLTTVDMLVEKTVLLRVRDSVHLVMVVPVVKVHALRVALEGALITAQAVAEKIRVLTDAQLIAPDALEHVTGAQAHVKVVLMDVLDVHLAVTSVQQAVSGNVVVNVYLNAVICAKMDAIHHVERVAKRTAPKHVMEHAHPNALVRWLGDPSPRCALGVLVIVLLYQHLLPI